MAVRAREEAWRRGRGEGKEGDMLCRKEPRADLPPHLPPACADAVILDTSADFITALRPSFTRGCYQRALYSSLARRRLFTWPPRPNPTNYHRLVPPAPPPAYGSSPQPRDASGKNARASRPQVSRRLLGVK